MDHRTLLEPEDEFAYEKVSTHAIMVLSLAVVMDATKVQIINDLPGMMVLTVHCKSKDDGDLGVHMLGPFGAWEV